MNMLRYYWFKLTLLFRPEERRRLKEYRVYFSKKLLEHQIDKLALYDPEYRVEIPQNPETFKRIFPK